MDEENKSVINLLSIDDIRTKSQNWTLAGDSGLLAYLEHFSEEFYNKAQEIQSHFNELIDSYDEVDKKISNTTNQFLALQNCQFVENRVYDEETPTEEIITNKVEDESEKEKLLLAQYKEAVEVGVRLLDTHFQEVELPLNSDSDEEGDISSENISLIWKAKNFYSEKKFPLLIGSFEWWEDDKVGLGIVEETLCAEKEISDSESDAVLTQDIEKVIQLSSSSSSSENKQIAPKFISNSSEDIFNLEKNYDSPMNNAVDRTSQKFLTKYEGQLNPNDEVVNSDDDIEKIEKEIENVSGGDSAIKNSKKVANAFTRELSSKLDSLNKINNISHQNTHAVELPIDVSKKSGDDSTGLFNKEVDKFSTKIKDRSMESKSLFFESETDALLFGGSNQLLFRSENDLFGTKSLNKSLKKIDKSIEGPPKEAKSKSKDSEVMDKDVKGLFDDLIDEEELFFSKSYSKRSDVVEKKSSQGSITEEVLGNITLPVDKLDNNFTSLFDSNVFDEESLLHESEHGLSTQSVLNKKTDLTSDNVGEDVMFHKNLLPKKISADCDDLFQEKPKHPDNLSLSSSRSSLFDDLNLSKSRLASVFEKDKSSKFEDDLFNGSDEPMFGENSLIKANVNDLFFAESEHTSKQIDKKISFLGDYDDTDDLFIQSRKKEGKKCTFPQKDLNDNTKNKTSELFSENEKYSDELFQKINSDDVFDEKVTKKFNNVKKSDIKSNLFDDSIEKIFDFDKENLFLSKSSIEERDANLEESTESKGKIGDGNDDLKENSLAFLDTLPNLESIIQDSNLFGGDAFSVEPFKSPTEPSLVLNRSGTTNTSKSKNVGKLNIPQGLKSKLESAVKLPTTEVGDSNKVLKRENRAQENVSDELSNSFQSSLNLLKCPNRNRVKIPIRRRPQSRRARQEALRNSEVDFLESSVKVADEKPVTLDEEVTVSLKETENDNKTSTNSFFSPLSTHPLSPSTDEEDFFKVPELDTNFEIDDQGIFKSNLFQPKKDSKIDDNLLFDEAPILSPLSLKKDETLFQGEGKAFDSFQPKPKKLEKESIFDFNDENHDYHASNLFKSLTKSKINEVEKTEVGTNYKKIKPLFDDETDEGDDLFENNVLSSKSIIPPKNFTKVSSEEKIPSMNSHKPFIDPLGLMSNDD